MWDREKYNEKNLNASIHDRVKGHIIQWRRCIKIVRLADGKEKIVQKSQGLLPTMSSLVLSFFRYASVENLQSKWLHFNCVVEGTTPTV